MPVCACAWCQAAGQLQALEMPSAPPGETLGPALDSLLAKLDQLGERPIEVSVTTLLDGRQVARSVYRDLRERKIKNYETL